mmetsp:Transcript_78455/g.240041  ORF Transcript_78455/g.240041 Transcript_78455/m.240041 type:complete len:278 (-) Transcript_78455:20-853(-)
MATHWGRGKGHVRPLALHGHTAGVARLGRLGQPQAAERAARLVEPQRGLKVHRRPGDRAGAAPPRGRLEDGVERRRRWPARRPGGRRVHLRPPAARGIALVGRAGADHRLRIALRRGRARGPRSPWRRPANVLPPVATRGIRGRAPVAPLALRGPLVRVARPGRLGQAHAAERRRGLRARRRKDIDAATGSIERGRLDDGVSRQRHGPELRLGQMRLHKWPLLLGCGQRRAPYQVYVCEGPHFPHRHVVGNVLEERILRDPSSGASRHECLRCVRAK